MPPTLRASQVQEERRMASSRAMLKMRVALADGVWAGRFLTATVEACFLVLASSCLRI